MLSKIRKIFRRNIGIDLGTANTLIYLEEEGIVFNEPTVIAMSESGRVLDVGARACSYLGRTPPGIMALRPMARGVISDFEAVASFIESILYMVRDHGALLAPNVVVCVPSNITRIEQRTVLDAVMEADIHEVWLMEEVMAAAVGAGAAYQGAPPAMVVDIGGGTTEAAVIGDMAYLACETLRVAGDEMNNAVERYMRRNRSLVISSSSAERLKWKAGAVPGWQGETIRVQVSGKNAMTAMPATCEVTSDELSSVFQSILDDIVDMVQGVVRQLDMETLHHVSSGRAILTGGGALLRGMDQYLSDHCGIGFQLADSPLETVIHGAGKAVENLPAFRSVFIN